jgi:hypothetical protein
VHPCLLSYISPHNVFSNSCRALEIEQRRQKWWQEVLAGQLEAEQAGGGIESKHSTDIESTTRARGSYRHTIVWGTVGHHKLSPCASMSIYPEGKS